MPHVPPSSPPDKYWSMDVFRGVCALAVFVSHLNVWSFFPAASAPERLFQEVFGGAVAGFDWLTWHTGGQHPAVIAFLVLSGFCIHLGMLRATSATPDRAINWAAYLRRRLHRILPVYWCGAVLGGIFVWAQYASPAPNPTLALNATSTPADLLARFAGMSSLYPREILSGNGILNYIGAELCLYVGYPFLFLLRRPVGWIWLCALALGGQVSAYFLAPHTSPYWAYNTPLMLGMFFVLGAMLAERQTRKKPCPDWRAALFAWAFFLVVRETLAFPARNLVLQLLWALVCVFLISWLVKLENRVPTLIRHPGIDRLARVGRVSFSLYVVHSPVLFLSAWTLYHFVPAPNYALQLALSLVGSVALTRLVYHLVERHCLRPRQP